MEGLIVCLVREDKDSEGYEFLSEFGIDLAMPQLLSQLGFLHIDSSQQMQDHFAIISDNICQLEMAGWQAKLHSIAGTNDPYALLDNYGRGVTVQVAGAAAYMLKCQPKQATKADYINCTCLLYTSPSPRDKRQSRMPSSA